MQIGTKFIKGISGEEKKRTSIGMEMIVSPKILFLDEPTTGLDESATMSIIALLKKYVIVPIIIKTNGSELCG